VTGLISNALAREPVRFFINGLIATAVHFGLLWLLFAKTQLLAAGIANMIAAGIAISTSFLGNRYFAYRAHAAPVVSQAGRFLVFYAALAVMHGLVLFTWTDVGGLDYRIGFLLATVVQTISSYLGGKHWVFKR